VRKKGSVWGEGPIADDTVSFVCETETVHDGLLNPFLSGCSAIWCETCVC